MYPVLSDFTDDILWFACPPKMRGRANPSLRALAALSVSSLSLSRFSQSLGKGCTHQQETFQCRRQNYFPTIQAAQDSCITILPIRSFSAVHLFPPMKFCITSASEYKGNSWEKAKV